MERNEEFWKRTHAAWEQGYELGVRHAKEDIAAVGIEALVDECVVLKKHFEEDTDNCEAEGYYEGYKHTCWKHIKTRSI